jgi:hypothetical protein
VTPNKVIVQVKLKIGTENDLVKAEWGKEDKTDYVMITLPRMRGRLDTATLNKPIKLGEIAGKTLGFYAAFSSSGESCVVTLQFVLGGKYE